MPNTKQPNPAKRLHAQLVRTLTATNASRDDVTEVLIHLLARQLASYPALEREAGLEAAILVLDQKTMEMGEDVDRKQSVLN